MVRYPSGRRGRSAKPLFAGSNPARTSIPNGPRTRGASTTVPVTLPEHLGDIQIATRRLCRANRFSDESVVDAVLGVSESAHRLLIENERAGKVRLSAVESDGERALLAEISYPVAGTPDAVRVEALWFTPRPPL